MYTVRINKAIGRQFSMDLSCFCMSYKQRFRGGPLFWNFFSRLLANSLGRYNVSPMVKRAGMLAAQYKRLGSPRSGFLSCNTSHCICRHLSRPIHIAHVRLGSKENWLNMLSHAACYAVRNEVLCLWPRNSCLLTTMKLWQLAYT